MFLYFIFGNNKCMIKSKLAIAIDSITASLLIFIVAFFWLKRYIKNALFLFFICIIISLVSFVTIFKNFIKNYNLQNISIKESKHLSKCLHSLKFSPHFTNVIFFEKLLKSKYLKNNIFENEQNIYYINLRTKLESKDFFDALDYQYKNNSKKLIFICENYSDEFKILLENKNDIFNICSSTELYNLMKETNTFPVIIEQKINFKQKMKNKIDRFISTLTKKHFKDYLFSGLSLIILSFFIPYSLYYAIIGTILLSISILCLVKSKNNKFRHQKNPLINSIKK